MNLSPCPPLSTPHHLLRRTVQWLCSIGTFGHTGSNHTKLVCVSIASLKVPWQENVALYMPWICLNIKGWQSDCVHECHFWIVFFGSHSNSFILVANVMFSLRESMTRPSVKKVWFTCRLEASIHPYRYTYWHALLGQNTKPAHACRGCIS